MSATATPQRVTPQDELLRTGYRECARITRQHGTTYYWGAVLLPRSQRRHVHAVYALCRLADDIVDAPQATADADRVPATRAALQEFRDHFTRALVLPAGVPVLGADGEPDAVMGAIAASVRDSGIHPECFDRFFDAMARDLDTTGYRSFDDLLGYMEGSAAVIGEMMLPVLRPTSPLALEPARSLGFAFQLTNFLRDVDEDLDRGRVYLPQDDLDRFGADPWRRRVDEPWREFMRFQIARNRELYDHARTGLDHLPPASARCVGTALLLYSRILDLIEQRDYDVFSERVRLPTWRKALTALEGTRQIPRGAREARIEEDA